MFLGSFPDEIPPLAANFGDRLGPVIAEFST
jgi:hypothetical protein